MSHTPGPWFWAGIPGKSNLRGTKGDDPVLSYSNYEGLWFSRWSAERMEDGESVENSANANLIALAPEMLKALKAVVYSGDFTEAEAVLAKAEGRS